MASRWLSAIHKVASKLKLREIRAEDEKLYLSRYRIFGYMPGEKPSRLPVSAYLHKFHLPDQDDAPHSHPWTWSFSIVLAGGYTEERVRVDSSPLQASTFFRRLYPGNLNVLTDRAYHRVSELHGKETWTLFVTGPKTASWGFLVPGRGHVPWKKRFAERSIEIPKGVG